MFAPLMSGILLSHKAGSLVSGYRIAQVVIACFAKPQPY
jgi:hypothetical protein